MSPLVVSFFLKKKIKIKRKLIYFDILSNEGSFVQKRMMEISTEDIKKVRRVTGAGIQDCKNALKTCNNSVEEAIKMLGEKAINSAPKKSAGSSKEGQIFFKVENGEKGGAGVLFEVMCETDFAAKSNAFVAWGQMLSDSGLILLKASEEGWREETIVSQKLGDSDLLSDSIKKITAKIGERITIRRMGGIKEGEGVVGGFVHAPGKVAKAGAVVSLRSPTPYRQKLTKLAEELAIHVTAFNPKYISRESVPQGVQVESDDILFEQQFEGGKTFGEYLQRTIKRDFRKEDIQVVSLFRFEIGENLEESQIALAKSPNKDSFGF